VAYQGWPVAADWHQRRRPEGATARGSCSGLRQQRAELEKWQCPMMEAGWSSSSMSG